MLHKRICLLPQPATASLPVTGSPFEQISKTLLEIFPAHAPQVEKRMQAPAAERAVIEELSANILAIAGNDATLRTYCEDYKWLTDRMLEEELYFRRHGRYRIATFEQAEKEVYANKDFMTRYMHGVLLSHLFWSNHTQVIQYLIETFLPGNKQGYRHLEVGPGHGLLLYRAAKDPRAASIAGWDVSETSMKMTEATLKAMGVQRPITLELKNLFANPVGEFDSIVFSEVLEHLEQPVEALKILANLTAPGGRLFINAPINSPAPDHIYLFNTPEEFIDMVKSVGLEVEDVLMAPVIGSTLERARALKFTISTVVIARKPQA